MPSSMPIDRSRQRVLRHHTKKQEEDAREKGGLPRGKLIVKGRAEQCPIYTLDIHELAFNKANGRVKAEVAEREAELGRQLDLFDEGDQKIIRRVLLSIRKDENEKIKEDLRKNGQITPGIITCDGIVVNGNRRKAILEELYEETKESRFRYLDVHVLPSDITKAELWLIEAGIQMSAQQQLDYSPINHLLKLREGITAGLDIDNMASRIYGVSRERIESDLQRLDLIDEYLREFLNKDHRYHLVKRVNEHFIDLQSIISWARRPRGRVKDWDWDENDITELKLVAFYCIRIGLSHMRVRGLCDLFARREAWLKIREALNVDANLTHEERRELNPISDSDDGEDDAPERFQEEDMPASRLEQSDMQEEAHWRKHHEGELKSLYEDAKEQEQIIRDSERPLALAKRALRNIEAVPQEPCKLDEPEIDEVLARIIGATNHLRKLIKTNCSARGGRRKSTAKRGRHLR